MANKKPGMIKRIINAFRNTPVTKKTGVKASNNVYNHFTNFNGYSSTTFNTRSFYESLGFPWNPSSKDFFDRFERQDVANRIIKAPVSGTWRYNPEIQEAEGEETQFEREIAETIERTKLFHYLSKLDMLAMLGQYSVLYLGFMDGTDPAIPAINAKGLAFVTPIREDNAAILEWETDMNSPRFGLPRSYNITTDVDVATTGINSSAPGAIPKTVHWSRVIHVAENTLDSDVYGIPYLRPILNRLIGLDKLTGGSPEMYWQCARPIYLADAEKLEDVEEDPAFIETLKNEVAALVKGNVRWMVTEGVNVQTLAPQLISPTDHVTVQLKMISAATRIPLRILTGSERGELSSSQDERGWLSYMEERRGQVAEKLILKPLIDRLIELKAVTPPGKTGYYIKWEPLISVTDREKAEVALIQMQTLKTRSETMGGDMIYPDEYILKQLGKTPEEIEHQLAVAKEELKKEDRDLKKSVEDEKKEKMNEQEKEENENEHE